MELKKVLFIINQKAGQNNRINLQECFVGKENEYECNIHILENNPLLEIEKAISQFRPEIIAAAGGDGTINLVARLIQNTGIKLLIIPMGSANGMAKEFDMPESLEDCLKLIETGKTVAIDLLKINDEISIHLADVGLNAKIVKRFQLDRKRGMLTYAKYLFNEVFFIKKRTFMLYLENETRRIKAVSITFANATKYGTGAVINPDGKLNDGLFELCIVKPFPKVHLFSIAIQMFRNRLKYSEYFETIHCKKAKLIAKYKTLLQVDGEVIGTVKEINMECLPGAVLMIIPDGLDYPTLVN
jgi:diacylglycerol kinase (ATP)